MRTSLSNKEREEGISGRRSRMYKYQDAKGSGEYGERMTGRLGDGDGL